MNKKTSYFISFLLIVNVLHAHDVTELKTIYNQLNLSIADVQDSIVTEELELVSIGENILGKEIFLSKKCAKAWEKMKYEAKKDSIQISVLSGFRSYNKQYAIIKNKLNRGMTLNQILKENKLPGLSHHHSGNAIDIISNSYKLSLDFEKSRAYLWLIQNAHKYGFYLQYPKNNKSGIMFEPWHWYFKD